MNKVIRTLLAIGLVLAVATPALAEFKLSGFYRLMGYAEEKKSTSHDYGDSQQFIDQRLRMRANWTLNDNVGMVYFAEVDTTWGENNKAALGQGGQSYLFSGGADGVNVETKQAFLDLKFGDTAAMIGIIGVADAFYSAVANDDMAGVQATHKMGNTSFKLVYSKWDEDDTDAATGDAGNANARGYWDDFDFYVAEVGHKFSDNFKAGAGIYWMDNNTNDGATNATDYDSEIFFYGLNGEAKFGGNFTVNGFVVVQDGEVDYSNRYAATTPDPHKKDQDITGMAASVKGTMKLENGDIGLRVIYFSEDDDDEDNGRWQGFKGNNAFNDENQIQFLTDKYSSNDSKERYAEVDAAEAGFGLLAFVLSGNHKLPENVYLGWGAGYYLAMDDERDDPSTAKPASGTQITSSNNYRRGDELGYELCVRVGKKFFEKVDLSLNASYAAYGDFYDDTVKEGTKVDDPDATYKTYLMVNVPF